MSYFRGAMGVILVYDICSKASFEAAKGVWFDQIKAHCEDSTVVLLLGNKVDQQAQRQVHNEAASFAARERLLFAEVSALTGQVGCLVLVLV